ncbi:hypothetical protein EG349_10280 [Chryseobacterium shandongense]|uniref:DUF1320 domain-containing protein n=2 Tax=Chryseobacterium TaxID=59732 RepID=A0AAD0YA61_9FLAO|nr:MULTISPECIES: hypothetical protein [Chryseobacterium]AZA87146.1 hypothetical protein EG349_10280 [Chryseobacterium shandongense]AZA95575.1 hypothetical protein EG353_08355 [Chryseobacterium shandongense]MEC3876145.1 hypothetical protein [Chryseobacterium sp. T9W2-O]
MIYLQNKDLNAYTLERLLDESVADFEQARDELEEHRITEVKSMISKYYDVENIFSKTSPVRHPHIIKILAKMVGYDMKRRTGRKAGESNEKDLEWAERELDKMHRGIIKFDDLPAKPVESTGTTASKMLYGNLKNPNFYI